MVKGHLERDPSRLRRRQILAAGGQRVDRVATNSTLAVELAKRAIHAENEAAKKAAMPQARAKLAELIDRRARALAEELHEEQRRVELAAVKTELELSPDDE